MLGKKTKTRKEESEKVSRRQFLKSAGLIIGGAALGHAEAEDRATFPEGCIKSAFLPGPMLRHWKKPLNALSAVTVKPGVPTIFRLEK